ncbi:hypothetical protein B0I35DRAFT_482245 [Stachybotrys elegans]|uniref:DUF6590 domain-containing protein n=1 Tax=Stachybotrys elegans TaxID=80388 RepID=A0A8K0SIZ9_9HYPO|nr:hypothetical protein B0I35DRAFT_482245 [Stachybotrys elegans]
MHKTSSKHKSKSHQGSEWSEWEYSEEYQRWWRCRVDRHGQIKYEYADPAESSSAAHDNTPRDQAAASMEEITAGISGLSHGGNDQAEEYDIPAYTAASDASAESHGRSKGKGKRHAHASSSGDGDDDDGSASQVYGDGTQGNYHTDSQYDGYTYGATQGQYFPYPDSSAQGYAHQPDPYSNYDTEDANDAALQSAMHNSRQHYDTYGRGESSAMGGSGSAYGLYEEERSATPRQEDYGGVASIQNEMEEQGELDPRYQVMRSDHFQPGEIFKVHWAEPQGSGHDNAATVSEQHEFRNKFGTKFYFGFRRFVVIANDQGHCTCVPILTYGGKACKKHGVKPSKHGIIYQAGHKPKPLRDEPKLGFPPVCVQMHEDSERLSRESRVNYSKLVTIEHNIRVFFIGRIVADDMDKVSEAVNSCWAAKIHRRKHK